MELLANAAHRARATSEADKQRDEPGLHQSNDAEEKPDGVRGTFGQRRARITETDGTRHRTLRDEDRSEGEELSHGMFLSFSNALRPYTTRIAPLSRNRTATVSAE